MRLVKSTIVLAMSTKDNRADIALPRRESRGIRWILRSALIDSDRIESGVRLHVRRQLSGGAG